MKYKWAPSSRGFTIVELLIVIVVIGILAALDIVAYNGIQNRAHDTSVRADLRNIAQKVEEFYVDNGFYPRNSAQVTSLSLRVSKGSYQTTTLANNMIFCFSSDGSVYSLWAQSNSNNRFYINHNNKTPTSTTQGSAGGINMCPALEVPSPSGWVWIYNTSTWQSAFVQ